MTNVSLIVPCRNEQRFIEHLLDSLISQDYATLQLEILVVDGMSIDGTREIIQEYAKKYSRIRLVDNPRHIIPAAMNIGIDKAKGDIIMKMDAHSAYPKNYVSKCVDALQRHNADNVGGILITKPSALTLRAKAIAYSLTHFFGVGSSPFRRQQQGSKPQQVDTVAFGCYKKDVFTRIGGYNEKLERSSDMELNLRLKRAGGTILLVPNIVASYYADATLSAFWRHNVKDGIWSTYPIKFVGNLLSWRHYIPLLFISVLIMLFALGTLIPMLFFAALLIVCLYISVAILVSIPFAIKQRRLAYMILLPTAFVIRHIGYGIGSLVGLVYVL